MTSREKYYLSKVLEWQKLYGVEDTKPRSFNLTTKKSIKGCAACLVTTNLHRHHKAHDFYFACLRPDLYAAQYILFADADIDYLCKKCHKAFHKVLSKEVKEANIYFTKHPKSQENCDKWKRTFLTKYNLWLDRRRALHNRRLHKPRT